MTHQGKERINFAEGSDCAERHIAAQAQRVCRRSAIGSYIGIGFRDPKRGNCAVCHTIEDHYALFTNGTFHNIGVGVNANGEITDLGRFDQTKSDAEKGKFKTPSLRNVALTPPYMHDGSLKTLKDVVDFYAGGGNSNPNLDKDIKPLHLSAQDRADLVAFLESLTGDMPKNAGAPGKD